MTHLLGPPVELAWIAVKAVLLYITALVAFRVTRCTVDEVSRTTSFTRSAQPY